MKTILKTLLLSAALCVQNSLAQTQIVSSPAIVSATGWSNLTAVSITNRFTLQQTSLQLSSTNPATTVTLNALVSFDGVHVQNVGVATFTVPTGTNENFTIAAFTTNVVMYLGYQFTTGPGATNNSWAQGQYDPFGF